MCSSENQDCRSSWTLRWCLVVNRLRVWWCWPWTSRGVPAKEIDTQVNVWAMRESMSRRRTQVMLRMNSILCKWTTKLVFLRLISVFNLFAGVNDEVHKWSFRVHGSLGVSMGARSWTKSCKPPLGCLLNRKPLWARRIAVRPYGLIADWNKSPPSLACHHWHVKLLSLAKTFLHCLRSLGFLLGYSMNSGLHCFILHSHSVSLSSVIHKFWAESASIIET